MRPCRQAARAWGPGDAGVNVELHEPEATGGLPIFSLNQWSRRGTMSEVHFQRCGIGNLNASRATYTNTPNPAATTGNHHQ